MRCSDAHVALSAQLDDELGARDAARLDRHLGQCASCRDRRDSLAAMHRRMRVTAAPAVDAGRAVPIIMERVATMAPPYRRARCTPGIPWARAVAVAAVVALVAVTATAITRWRDDTVRVSTRSGAIAPVAGHDLLLLWTSGGLPDGIAARVREVPGVRGVVEVRGDVITLPAADPAAGVVPVEAIAVDPEPYATLLDGQAAAAVRSLGPHDALLSTTGARLRHAHAGATLRLANGARLHVIGVVPDDVTSGAEMVVATGSNTGVVTPRYLLVEYDGDRAELEGALQKTAPNDPMRFRAPGEARFLRHGDAVLPLGLVKARFGEFAYRDLGHGRLAVDARWVARNIVQRDVPYVGSVRCHRLVIDDLAAALRSLSPVAAASIRFGPATCFAEYPGRPGLGPSRHAFGIAVTFATEPPQKGGAAIDPRVVDAMAAHGFAWGGRWLVPAPDEFEWTGNP